MIGQVQIQTTLLQRTGWGRRNPWPRAGFTGSRWCRAGTGCQAKGSGKAAPRHWPLALGLWCSSPDSTEDTRGKKTAVFSLKSGLGWAQPEPHTGDITLATFSTVIKPQTAIFMRRCQHFSFKTV